MTASCSGALFLLRCSTKDLIPPSYLKTCFFSPFGIALVDGLDRDAPVQERELAEALREPVEVVARDREDLGVRLERDLRARLRGLPDLADGLDGDALGIPLLPDLALALDLDEERARERVHDGEADAVEAARDLVRVVVELAARVEVREDDLERLALVDGVRPDRDAAAVVLDRDGVVRVDDDADRVAVAGLRLVDRVVDELGDHVVQARDVVGVPDVHPGPLAHGLEPLEELDRRGAVVVARVRVRRGRVHRHAGSGRHGISRSPGPRRAHRPPPRATRVADRPAPRIPSRARRPAAMR